MKILCLLGGEYTERRKIARQIAALSPFISYFPFSDHYFSSQRSRSNRYVWIVDNVADNQTASFLRAYGARFGIVDACDVPNQFKIQKQDVFVRYMPSYSEDNHVLDPLEFYSEVSCLSRYL